MLTIYKYPLKNLTVEKFKSILELGLAKHLKVENISIIFISKSEIQKLNKEYRNTDTATDVLSFNYDTKELLGEVYVSLDYIKENTVNIDILEEVLRLCIHGILHLYGYDHMKEFITRDENLENMYVIQESILDNCLKQIK